jgi:hypothetical protein
MTMTNEKEKLTNFKNIADILDTYVDTDKKFMLWYLLGYFKSEINIEDLENIRIILQKDIF